MAYKQLVSNMLHAKNFEAMSAINKILIHQPYCIIPNQLPKLSDKILNFYPKPPLCEMMEILHV